MSMTTRVNVQLTRGLSGSRTPGRFRGFFVKLDPSRVRSVESMNRPGAVT